MEFFNVLTAKEVHDIIKELARDYFIQSETIDLISAAGRIASEEILAPVNLPEFNRSTVDGYAVISQEVMGASESMPSFLDCVSEVAMGETTDFVLQKGQAVYVPTGGMVPEGADGVVMIEYVEKLDEKTILIHRPIAPLGNMTLIGDDLKAGELIISKGKKLTPYDIGLLAGQGIHKIEVYQKLRFAVISTGDEIIDLEEPKKLGQIRDINGYALSSLITQLGGEVINKSIVRDNFEKLKETLGEVLNQADIVLLSGGSSVGTRDYTKAIIESFAEGEVLVHGISIKPGKPTILGHIGKKVVFGLPGHPASALIIFNQFVKAYMQQLLKRPETDFGIMATLAANVHASPGKETYQMVQLVQSDEGWNAHPFYAKSGMMSLLAKASGYLRIPGSIEGLMKGEKVKVYLLQEVEL
ncbi:molybdopterin molybdotransferase MoeA [Cellulosilyticum sp. I15G10I2]|uniref:molybdopterin molybdotransferase MoeA n=1 Tax=Cellulosilyticum sp. I15G10I2 TaxID=1892843 RepID=UPI00085BC488|nr:gephyrin-like molybdotransferase Glp [Cellulosilyticum sp. I15G10I2]